MECKEGQIHVSTAIQELCFNFIYFFKFRIGCIYFSYFKWNKINSIYAMKLRSLRFSSIYFVLCHQLHFITSLMRVNIIGKNL